METLVTRTVFSPMSTMIRAHGSTVLLKEAIGTTPRISLAWVLIGLLMRLKLQVSEVEVEPVSLLGSSTLSCQRSPMDAHHTSSLTLTSLSQVPARTEKFCVTYGI